MLSTYKNILFIYTHTYTQTNTHVPARTSLFNAPITRPRRDTETRGHYAAEILVQAFLSLPRDPGSRRRR